jgi:hypothetical protein
MDITDNQHEGGVNRPDAQSEADPKIEDLYKSDVDRRLWAPSPDTDESGPGWRQRLRRWGQALTAAVHRLLSYR